MKIGTAIDKFLLQIEADGRSPHTIGQYRRHAQLFATWLAGVGDSGDISAIDHRGGCPVLCFRYGQHEHPRRQEKSHFDQLFE